MAKKVAQSGTTKPLPTSDPKDKEQQAAKTRTEEMARKAEEKRKAQEQAEKEEIKRLEEEIKRKKGAVRKREKAEKEAKQQAREKAKQEREAKIEAIKEADAAIEKCLADLEKTEEWKLLQKAKAAREAIGPLPRATRSGSTIRKVTNGLTPNMVRVLTLMSDGEIRLAADIGRETKIAKGKRLPELVERGMLKQLVPEEGVRGSRFQITDAGRAALEEALATEE
jgi:DNA repair exonuclease SbcCD ATPase subunit